VILSGVVCPGAGQVYNRQRGKGLAMMMATVGSSLAVVALVVRNVLRALPEDVLTLTPAQMTTLVQQARSGPLVASCTVVLGVLWIWSVIDAYLVARRSADAPASTISR
jgi:hypothetical protein